MRAEEAEQMRRTNEAYERMRAALKEALAAGLRGDPIPERYSMIASVQQAYRDGRERAAKGGGLPPPAEGSGS